MSRLLFQLDGASVSVQNGAIPPDHVLMVLGANVAVLNVDLALPDRSGLPRTDYARVYNVIPPEATEEQAVEIFRAGWRRAHETSGGSYDDSGIGALSNKLAVLYGVANRETEFRNWFAANYHGTQLEFRALPLRQEAQP